MSTPLWKEQFRMNEETIARFAGFQTDEDEIDRLECGCKKGNCRCDDGWDRRDEQ